MGKPQPVGAGAPAALEAPPAQQLGGEARVHAPPPPLASVSKMEKFKKYVTLLVCSALDAKCGCNVHHLCFAAASCCQSMTTP